MSECFQLEELREQLTNPQTKVVEGWHDGISGKSAMVNMLECNQSEADRVSFRVVTHPVMIQGTKTPICWVSWTYDLRDGEAGKAKAKAVCIEQARWIAERINANS